MRYFLILLLLAPSACKDDKASSADSPTRVEPSKIARAPRAAPADAFVPEPTPPTGPVDMSKIEIVPGESLGPIKIGMTRREVDALGILKQHPQYTGMTVPFTIYYDGDKVSGAEVSLKHAPVDIDVGDIRVPRTATMESAAELLKDCKEPDIRKGGTLVPCYAGTLSVNVGSGSPDEVWLRIWRPGDWK